MMSGHERIQRWAAVGLALAGIVIFANWSLRPATAELSYGYASYYTAASLVREDVDTRQFYENRWFLERTRELGFIETPDIFFINPPPTALLLLPVTFLNVTDADVVWTLVNIPLLILALAIVFDTLRAAGLNIGRGSVLFWALLALVAVFNPLWENTFFGQVYVLLLLLLALFMRAYVLDQKGRMGISLGLLFTAKTAGALLWGLLLLERRFRSLAWGVGTIVAVIVASTPLLGLGMWWEYLHRLPGLFDQPWSGVTAYQTTTSFIHHNFHLEPRSNDAPLADLPSIVAPLSTATNAILFGLAALAGWVLQRDLDDMRLRLARFSLMSALMIPLQPLGEEYHYVLTLPAIITSIMLSLSEPAGVRRELMLLCVSLATLLIAFPLHQTHPSLAPGFRALFAYPKLYGGLLIAGAMTIQLVIAPAGWGIRLRAALASVAAIRRRSQSRQLAS